MQSKGQSNEQATFAQLKMTLYNYKSLRKRGWVGGSLALWIIIHAPKYCAAWGAPPLKRTPAVFTTTHKMEHAGSTRWAK